MGRQMVTAEVKSLVVVKGFDVVGKPFGKPFIKLETFLVCFLQLINAGQRHNYLRNLPKGEMQGFWGLIAQKTHEPKCLSRSFDSLLIRILARPLFLIWRTLSRVSPISLPISSNSRS